LADRYRDSPRTVRLSYDDHEWLAQLAEDENLSIRIVVKRAVKHFRYWQEQGQEALKETLETFEAERSLHEDELRLRQHYQRKYELNSRRLHDALCDMRSLRAKYESRLGDERNLRAERENRLRDERDYYERQARAAESDQSVSYSPTVAKLLALAIRSDSDAEAMTALAKARAVHRKGRLPALACRLPARRSSVVSFWTATTPAAALGASRMALTSADATITPSAALTLSPRTRQSRDLRP
jgi:predicted transcriptional regulator